MGFSLDALVFSFEDRYSKNEIYQKMIDLGLREEEDSVQGTSSSLELKLPAELPSAEEAMKHISATLTTLKQQGLCIGQT
jgi:hypothetical protein